MRISPSSQRQLHQAANGVTAHATGTDPQSATAGEEFDDYVASSGTAKSGAVEPHHTTKGARYSSTSTDTASLSKQTRNAGADAPAASDKPSGLVAMLSQAAALSTREGGTEIKLMAALPGSKVGASVLPQSDRTNGAEESGIVIGTQGAGATALATVATAKKGLALDQQSTKPAPQGSSTAGPSADLLGLLSNRSSARPSARSTDSGSSDAISTTAKKGATSTSGVSVRIGTADEVEPTNGTTPPGRSSATLISDVLVEDHVAPASGARTAPANGEGNPTPGTPEDAASLLTASPPAAGQVDATALTAVRTISGGVVALVSQSAARTASPSAKISAAVGGTVPGAVRTMTLQLSPADLGTVSVRLHVTGQTLDVELSVSDQRTYGLVSRERDALASALRDQSYDLHSLVIQSAGSGAAPPQDRYLPNQGSGDSATSADRDFTSGGGGDTGRQQSSDGGAGAEGEELGSASGGAERSLGGLFV